jgi:steroid 5-alpha reductase family enzyme
MWTIYFQALAVILGMGVLTWLYSLYRHDVSMVDSLWSLMFLAAALLYAWQAPEQGWHTVLILALVAIWSLRLSIHLTVRNWDEQEDHRYQEIRRNNEPNFGLKSLYIIFGLQGLLAWIISIPLLFALFARTGFHWLDIVAVALWLTGFTFEAVGDYQLLKFKDDKANKGKVLDSGLWQYTRHPNYFGEACIWWAFFLLAIPAGGWWTVYASVLMTFLLLKVSGVVLMEKDIGKRRPEYQAYIDRTNAFFPGRPREAGNVVMEEQS